MSSSKSLTYERNSTALFLNKLERNRSPLWKFPTDYLSTINALCDGFLPNKSIFSTEVSIVYSGTLIDRLKNGWKPLKTTKKMFIAKRSLIFKCFLSKKMNYCYFLLILIFTCKIGRQKMKWIFSRLKVDCCQSENNQKSPDLCQNRRLSDCRGLFRRRLKYGVFPQVKQSIEVYSKFTRQSPKHTFIINHGITLIAIHVPTGISNWHIFPTEL